jgi:4-diphosphocytidyl-2-C-methyl-D-erythritol kinase
MSKSVVLRPSAKINLSLAIGPRRPDGYHEVRTILQSIALHDTLRVTARRGPFALATRGLAAPADRTNLVWRAAAMLWTSMGRRGEPSGIDVQLIKRIPAQAGLGGGSADAAAALVALDTIWGARRSRQDLIALAAQLGADVPFFLVGGAALGVARGEFLYPLADVRPVDVLIVLPEFGVSTADAYAWLDRDREAGLPLESAGGSIDLGWPTGPLRTGNDLQAPVVRRHPAVREIVEKCLRAGALAASMSGSGSAVFAAFPAGKAPRAARSLSRHDWRIVATRTLTRREAIARVGLRLRST